MATVTCTLSLAAALLQLCPNAPTRCIPSPRAPGREYCIPDKCDLNEAAAIAGTPLGAASWICKNADGSAAYTIDSPSIR